VSYGATALAYGTETANNWYGNNWRGLKQAVTGTAQTVCDVSGSATYAVGSLVDNDFAYRSWGGSVERFGGVLDAMRGGSETSSAYQIGYGGLNAATLLVPLRWGTAGRMGEFSAIEPVAQRGGLQIRLNPQASELGGINISGANAVVRNWTGQPVRIPRGHVMSPRDPAMSVKPIIDPGPFTQVQREAFLRGESAGTRLSPHHRHQIPTTHGGVIDELPGPGHPAGNAHTGGSPTRHPSPSVFNSMPDGDLLRSREIIEHWRAKGNRLIEVEPGVWFDLGPK
jgi:hypothetical protein